MEFQDVVRRRRMVRRFTAEPVDPQAVDRMLTNAVRAPNAGFAQGWAFLVLDQPDDVARFWEIASPRDPARSMTAWSAGMRTAPVLIVALTSQAAYLRRYAEDDKRAADSWAQGQPRWAVPYWHVDAGMASLLVLQTAVDEGLGACFFGLPPERVDAFRAAFGVPGEYAPTGAIAVGHPADDTPTGSPTRRPRKPLGDVVHRGRWEGGRLG